MGRELRDTMARTTRTEPCSGSYRKQHCHDEGAGPSGCGHQGGKTNVRHVLSLPVRATLALNLLSRRSARAFEVLTHRLKPNEIGHIVRI